MAKPTFTMSELLQAGVHFGHKSYRWNPKMASFIFGERNGIHILDLRQTVPAMLTSLALIEGAVAKGGRVLFVGTKRQAQDLIAQAAERSGQYYINHRWLGGMLTNWKTVSNSIKRLKDLEKIFAAEAAQAEEGTAPKLVRSKKEMLMMSREYEKLNRTLGGIKDMGGLPDVVVVLDVNKDHIAIAEANCLGIPVIGVLDSNSNPEGVQYAIPGNDDSTRAITLYTRLMSDAALAGIAAQASGNAMRTAAVATKGAAKSAPKVQLSAKAEAAGEQAEVEAKAEEVVAAATTAAKKPAVKAAASK